MKTHIKLLLSSISTVGLSVFIVAHYFIHTIEKNPLQQLSTNSSIDLTKSNEMNWLSFIIISIFLVFNLCLWTRKRHRCITKDNKEVFDFFKTNNNEKEINHE